jgi:co-chaperonin GroES (HSP10)
MLIFVVLLYIFMQHIYNYIIKISNELNETFKTEGGLELYGHKDFSKDRLSNRYAIIVGKPLIFDDKILEIGTKVLIDPSVYYHSTHGDDDILQITTNTVDREKGLYAIEPQNIVLYEKDGDWFGYLGNFLGKCVTEKKPDKMAGSFIVEIGNEVRTDNFDVIYANDFLIKEGINQGDRLYMKPNMGVPVWIEGKEHTWLRYSEVLGIHN